jgi:hypothetical protein
MANDWILDVLADLKHFAAKNDLSALAAQLELAGAVAEREITSTKLRAPALSGLHAVKARMVHPTFAGVDDA